MFLLGNYVYTIVATRMRNSKLRNNIGLCIRAIRNKYSIMIYCTDTDRLQRVTEHIRGHMKQHKYVHLHHRCGESAIEFEHRFMRGVGRNREKSERVVVTVERLVHVHYTYMRHRMMSFCFDHI